MRSDWRILVGVAVVAAVVGWLAMRTVSPPEVDPQEMDVGLAELAEALRLDEHPEAEIFPPAVEPVQIRPTVRYRKALQFWQPAVGAASKGGHP